MAENVADFDKVPAFHIYLDGQSPKVFGFATGETLPLLPDRPAADSGVHGSHFRDRKTDSARLSAVPHRIAQLSVAALSWPQLVWTVYRSTRKHNPNKPIVTYTLIQAISEYVCASRTRHNVESMCVQRGNYCKHIMIVLYLIRTVIILN